MDAQPPSFFARLALAWRILLDAVLASRLRRAAEGEVEALPALKPAPAEAKAPDATPALQLLSLLQREGRFLDFLKEDVSAFSDAEVGAAARVVHEGCKRVLDEHFTVRPIRNEPEGAEVVLEPGFDARRNRLTGNVRGEPPYRGRLQHPGWQVVEARLPALNAGHDPTVVAPAEIEL